MPSVEAIWLAEDESAQWLDESYDIEHNSSMNELYTHNSSLKFILNTQKSLWFFNHFAISGVAVGVVGKIIIQKIMGIHLQ